MAPSRVSPSPPNDESEQYPGLTPKQLATFHRDGYLIIPNYLSQETCQTLLSKTHQLLQDFPLANHPMTKFVTGTGNDDDDDADTTTISSKHVGDTYFLTSGDKVRFFFEESAFSPTTGALTKPKHLAINKIGHNLHGLIPEFRDVSSNQSTAIGRRNAAIARDLGYRDPRLLQSMVICKQPEIGGAVPPHQDSTFLYTDRPSAVGFWIALEDATVENGCLSFAPGSHRRAPVGERFVRKKKVDGDGDEDVGTGFEKVESEEGMWPREFEHENLLPAAKVEEKYVLGEVTAGTLVLIHGNTLHKSEKNLSQKGRIIYTFHVIEGEEMYDDRNWLQILGGSSAFTRLGASAD